MAYISIKKFKEDPSKFSKEQITDMCRNQKLTEDFMRTYAKWLDWKAISVDQELTEEFMDEMHDYIYFEAICVWFKHPHFSDWFMDKYKDYLDWESLARYCTSLTKDFIYSHMDYIRINDLLKNEWVMKNLKTIELISDYLKFHYTALFDWNYPAFNDITKEFVREYKDNITNWRHVISHFADDMDFHNEFHDYYTDNEWIYLSEHSSSYSFDFIMKYVDKWNYKHMYVPLFPTKYLNVDDIRKFEKLLNVMKNRKQI